MQRIAHAVLTLTLAAPVALPRVVQDLAPFPASAPAEQGLDPEALELLASEVDRLVATDSVIGAELHVIQNRHTVLHRAFGLADRDESRPMKVNSVFCIRSMTKPFVGTAIQMLLDEGQLTLDTRAAELLPAYDTPTTRDITIEHLLTHTTGLPFTTITRSLDQYGSLADIAAEAAGTKLLFRPGKGFQYSDAGSDTLGAIVAEITGAPVEGFVQERILDPLDMTDTWTLLEADREPMSRIPSAYSGAVGAWMRHWTPSAGPFFPMFLTSQSLYSTTADYGRFLALWMDGGGDLLSAAAIERGLTPRNSLGSHCGFENTNVWYGQQWMLYTLAREDDAESGEPTASDVVVFGHNGSDGTHAWAWPDRDLMVLYFTQTRGTRSGFEVERAVDRLLIQGDVEGFRQEVEARAFAGEELAPYEGLYWDEDNIRAYYVVTADDEQLSIERPGAFMSALVPTGTPGHFNLQGGAAQVLEFEPPVEGTSAAFLFPFSNRVERQVRHRPTADLPAVDTLLAELRDAHGADRHEEVGVIRMKGKLKMPARGLEGLVDHVFDGQRSRLEVRMIGNREVIWITGDDRVFTQVNGKEVVEVDGVMREQTLQRHPLRRYLGWRESYASVEVLKRIEKGDRRAWMLRTVSHGGEGSTKIVDADTGRLIAEDRFEMLPGAGRIGVEVGYGDFRDVEGLVLPFGLHLDYSFALIGEMQFAFETVETGVDESLLELPAED